MFGPNFDKTAFTQTLLKGLEARAAETGESEKNLATRLGSSDGLFKNLRKGSLPTVDRLHVILMELGKAITLGTPPPADEPRDFDLDGEIYAHVPLHDAMLAAGDGFNNSGEQIIDQLAFRRDWLARLRLPASKARLARVHGDSMQPTMWPGDMILIDTQTTELLVRPKDAKDLRRSPVYAMIDNGEARVKRIERPSPELMMLLSDNPDYAPELRQGPDLANIKIIGKVVWWGHTAKE